MPYLSWLEGNQLMRHALHEACRVGRDPLVCAVALPRLASLSKVQAVVEPRAGAWWVKPLDPVNPIHLNGVRLDASEPAALHEGDTLHLNGWEISYTEDFPGLDGTTFAEHIGELFQEIRPDSHHAATLIGSIELLQQCTTKLLRLVDSETAVKRILEEAVRLLNADRGFLLLPQREGGWRTAHRIGDIQEGRGIFRRVMDYVEEERFALLSNQPAADPRFGNQAPDEPRVGALLAAAMEDEGDLLGMLYLDRTASNQPFSRLDLALFQAFVRQGALALYQAIQNRQALHFAEQRGELGRLRLDRQRESERHFGLLAALGAPLRRLLSVAAGFEGESGDVVRRQALQMAALLEHGLSGPPGEGAQPGGTPLKVAALHGELCASWSSLLGLRKAILAAQPPPPGSVWLDAAPLRLALAELVEPMLMQLKEGDTLAARWDQEPGFQVLRLTWPADSNGPVADPWTRQVLKDAGVSYKWANQQLDLRFPESPDSLPDEPPLPLLGLVTEDLNLLGLFQMVAEADGLDLDPLKPEPGLSPLPRHRFLVVDAKGMLQPETCIRAYRHHPAFSTAPILVLRCTDEQIPSLMSAGATDWLPEGFNWEALHHRLQVLKGHIQLKELAKGAERLETFRQMAGSLKHEINNPLAIISMQVELLQRKYPEEPKLDKIGEMVERIHGLVQVLQKMREQNPEAYADGSTILKL